jgi:hypothetical protein
MIPEPAEPDSLFCVRPDHEMRSAADPSDINVALGGEAEGGLHFAEGDIESCFGVAARHVWDCWPASSAVAVKRIRSKSLREGAFSR